MTTAHPVPKPPAEPVPMEGLRTSLDVVLRLVLSRLDLNRATPTAARLSLAAAGVTVTDEWAADWLARAREIHGTIPTTKETQS